MKQERVLTLAFCALSLLFACESAPESAVEQREGLLFGLQEQDVLYIHASYVPDEDLSLTRARLTAPFDCSLFDDLCEQIGREAAIEFTAEVVDLTLDGATLEEIDAFNDAFLMRAMDEYEPDEDAVVLRGSGPWVTATSGRFRLRVRNGITTPISGSRQAWTEARTQRRSNLGIWSAANAVRICVDAGTNTQTVSTMGWNHPLTVDPVESIDPFETCVVSTSSHQVRTFHARNNGYSGNGLDSWYDLSANGSARASISGVSLTRTAPARTESF